MLNPQVVPARKLQASYKAIIEEVKTTKKIVLLTTNDQPQAAIVSLEDLKHLQEAKLNQGAQTLLKLAEEHIDELSKLPADLRDQANDILYSK